MKKKKITAKTISLLMRLRDGEEINASEFGSVKLKQLATRLIELKALSFVLIGKSQGKYYVRDKAMFEDACEMIDSSFKRLDGLNKIVDKKVSRADKVRECGNSKMFGADKVTKGFNILADREITIKYLGRDYDISPNCGLLVVKRKELVIPADAKIIIIENTEPFYDMRWMPILGFEASKGPYFLLCRKGEFGNAKEWLEEISNKCFYFGDFDLAGIRIFETEFKRRLKEKITFIVPDDIENRIRKNGNPGIYTDQIKKGYGSTKSEELSELIKLIHNLQSSYEQEGYCYPLNNG